MVDIAQSKQFSKNMLFLQLTVSNWPSLFPQWYPVIVAKCLLTLGHSIFHGTAYRILWQKIRQLKTRTFWWMLWTCFYCLQSLHPLFLLTTYHLSLIITSYTHEADIESRLCIFCCKLRWTSVSSRTQTDLHVIVSFKTR